MRSIDTDHELRHLFDRVVECANNYGRTLPEMRFFILNPMEFASLLEKNVYPTSPVNIWEGRNMSARKHRIQSGQESALYYEVVQTGNPSYAYLNSTNSAMTQASVMAHVVGHCEFSELNVMHDSKPDRTEYVMYLVKQVNMGRKQMGDVQYTNYWNACESCTSLIAPNSQYNLVNSVDSDHELPTSQKLDEEEGRAGEKGASMFSSTLDNLFESQKEESAFKTELQQKIKTEAMSRRGYKLRAPCQDIFGFLMKYSPMSSAERSILKYLYTINMPHDFVMRTQIMNEGWAMYWEKKIMLDLFREKDVTGIIDYSRIFAGVCYPRPYFQRNPYHLGYHMWNHIHDLFVDGKVSIDYYEEKDMDKKENWKEPNDRDPHEAMTHIVETVTDYEFLRRFLTVDLIEEYHLNRIDKRMAKSLGIKPSDVVKEDPYYLWLDPEPVLPEMLKFFTHAYRPRIYVIDNDFLDGGILLFHRDDGMKLKKKWIEPTLKNVNYIWKAPAYLISDQHLHQYSSNSYKETSIPELTFEAVVEKMRKSEKPFSL